jgi:cyclase
MMRTLVLTGIVVGGLIAAIAAQQLGTQGSPGGGPQGGVFGPVGKIERIADSIYRVTGAGGATAAFVSATGVVLVDTKLPGNGQAILDQIKTVTDKPVTMIINTHTHADHTGNNAFFPANVDVVAQDNTAANMRKMPEFQAPAGAPGLPDRTFKDRLTVLGGNDAIDLYYFGRAHTDGDTLVVFRSRRVMHAGDMFANMTPPIVDTQNGGSAVEFPDTIRKALAAVKNVDTIITGHTDLKKWPDFMVHEQFTRAMVDHARKSLAAGKTPEQAMADFKATLPEQFKVYALNAARGGPAGNFAVLYDELRQKR